MASRRSVEASYGKTMVLIPFFIFEYAEHSKILPNFAVGTTSCLNIKSSSLRHAQTSSQATSIAIQLTYVNCPY
ncbi:hypothetical protein HETIRDRAFT_442213 [Heterobasidion irregulare TC 32-1]|uniref:Uncharacterized protein n=1 Tax=Heterobasidion irregulare (strain TC 32-1) TaxID=747525 RepID=W4JQG6_HETIT|nr:uncharacterized protein HETIRDRAFT_442213 [Heterobasidion irregulare TC 32-1]ETW75729.1 hypothetical protein HETIRDRAFT_442213 [Heterobasidion irregulare TC 32-1]